MLAPGVLDRMTDVMSHRGPDDRGTYEAAGVALGARRLVDRRCGGWPSAGSERGRGRCGRARTGAVQPSRAAPAAGADGHRFASRCDTEILPHLYEREGERFAERLRGKFGIAVWDGRAATRGAGPRPARGQAALLGAARRPRPLRLRAEERARERADRAASSTTRRSTPTSPSASSPRPARRSPACRSSCPATG